MLHNRRLIMDIHIREGMRTALITQQQRVALAIVNGYAKEVLNKLPMEFAVEAQKLLAISLEGSVG